MRTYVSARAMDVKAQQVPWGDWLFGGVTYPRGTELYDDGKTYKHKYFGLGVHQLSRGCKFNGGVCSIKTMYKCVRRKPVDMIVRELKASKEKLIFFADDNIFFDRSSAVELFRALIPLKKKWACQISMDAARDDELLSMMMR